jgi:hypothetical protein
MTAGFVRIFVMLRIFLRKRLRSAFNTRSLRTPALWIACAPLLGALAACSGHDNDRATLTASAARELNGAQAPQSANAITAFSAASESSSSGTNTHSNAGEAALPPLAVRTPAKLPDDGSPGIEPLVTPEIHTAD